MTTLAIETEAEDIQLCCVAPGARAVCLIGDFNGWNQFSHPMDRHLDGSWWINLRLHSGHHHYLFIVDGKAQLDLNAMCVDDAERMEKVSLIAIG